MADELEDNFLIEDGDSIIASDDEAGEGVVVDERGREVLTKWG